MINRVGYVRTAENANDGCSGDGERWGRMDASPTKNKAVVRQQSIGERKNSPCINGGKQNNKPKNLKLNSRQDLYCLHMMLLYHDMTLSHNEKQGRE